MALQSPPESGRSFIEEAGDEVRKVGGVAEDVLRHAIGGALHLPRTLLHRLSGGHYDWDNVDGQVSYLINEI